MSTLVRRRSVLTAASSALLLPVTARAASAASGHPDTVPVGASSGHVLEQQSPIDVRFEDWSIRDDLPPLQVRYPGSATVRAAYASHGQAAGDHGSARGPEDTVQVAVDHGDADVVVDGVVHTLQQFHFHTPSEHRFGGGRAPLEQHLVHSSDDGRILVIGVPLLPGRATEADRVLGRLPTGPGAAPVELEGFDLRSLLPSHLSTVRYQGSLTTAPYTEGVQWFLTHPMTVTAGGIASFQALFPEGNAREVQPLNGRQVLVEAF